MAAATAVVQGKVVGNARMQGGPTSLQSAAYAQDPEVGVSGPGASNSSSVANGSTTAAAGIDVFQFACKDARLPPSIRLDFVKKVYAILGMMLLITAGIASPFIFATEKTMAWFQSYPWVLNIVMALLVMQYVLNMCIACQMCCGGSSFMLAYLRMFKTAPWNYIYLFTFAACFGVVVGFVCAQYTVQSVLVVFGLTVVLIVALTVYAVRTQADFTGCGAYVVVMFVGLLLLLLVSMFLPNSTFVQKIVAGFGAILFGFLIVYDTQQIFGSSSKLFGGGQRAIEYTVDMYAFAAWNLYLDFINFFLYMLQLFGDRK